MKNEKCSWCGQKILPGQGAISNGKHYHNRCLTTRNLAGKTQRAEAELDLPYEPIVTHAETQRATDELLTSTNFNWKEAAKESRMRILEKYGSGMNK